MVLGESLEPTSNIQKAPQRPEHNQTHTHTHIIQKPGNEDLKVSTGRSEIAYDACK